MSKYLETNTVTVEVPWSHQVLVLSNDEIYAIQAALEIYAHQMAEESNRRKEMFDDNPADDEYCLILKTIREVEEQVC